VYANRKNLTAHELTLRLNELESAVRPPLAIDRLKLAEGLAMYIARSAPSGQIANLAMLVMSDLAEIRSKPDRLAGNGTLEKRLAELRTVLAESKDAAAAD
jgi:hypothetical protein